MAKTDQSDMCESHIMTQLAIIDEQLEQCNMELSKQAKSSIMNQLPSLEKIDIDLKAYVSLQQNRLVTRIDHQLIRYQNDIRNQQLYRQLFTYNLIHD